MKPKALLFLPYLAPYRVDVLNELGNYFELTAIFQFDNAPEQSFNQKDLRVKLKIDFEIFDTGINVGTRQIRIGLYNLLKKHKPEIIFSNEFGPTSLIIALYKQLGFFSFTHFATTSDNYIMAANAKWFRRIARWLVLKSAKGIIVYENEVKNWYSKHFPKLTTRVCPNIQNPSHLLSNINIISEISKKYSTAYTLTGKRVLLYVGRLHKVKGLDLLLHAFAKVSTGNEILILVGEGPQKDELLKITEKLNLSDSVIFPGRFERDNLYAWYLVADFFILPSTHEPFGAVVNEALIFGLPVLCSKYAGAKYYIEPNINGYIFNPLDNDEFCLYLNKTLIKFNKNSDRHNLMTYSFKESVNQYQLALKDNQ